MIDFFEGVRSKKRKSGKQKREKREKQFYLRWTGSWYRQLKIFQSSNLSRIHIFEVDRLGTQQEMMYFK